MQKQSVSGMEASRIVYGCASLAPWNGDLTAEQKKRSLAALECALERGVNYFDHADIYAQGRSEEVFSGIWTGRSNLRGEVIIQSKCGIRFAGESGPHRYDFSREHILRSVEGSLARLDTDYLDVLLLHRPDPLVEPEEVAMAFDQLHAQGKVRHFGVSNHNAAQIALLQAWISRPLIVNQMQFSLLHSNLAAEGVIVNRDDPPKPARSEGTLEYCRMSDITIQAYSPLAQGRFTGRADGEADERTQNLARAVAEMAQVKGVPAEAVALAWILRHPAGIQPVIGTGRPERIKKACQAPGVNLSREEWYQLFLAGRGAKLP